MRRLLKYIVEGITEYWSVVSMTQYVGRNCYLEASKSFYEGLKKWKQSK